MVLTRHCSKNMQKDDATTRADHDQACDCASPLYDNTTQYLQMQTHSPARYDVITVCSPQFVHPSLLTWLMGTKLSLAKDLLLLPAVLRYSVL
jgi:hypothetical protein